MLWESLTVIYSVIDLRMYSIASRDSRRYLWCVGSVTRYQNNRPFLRHHQKRPSPVVTL